MMEEKGLLVAIEILGHNSSKETHQDDVLIIFDSVQHVQENVAWSMLSPKTMQRNHAIYTHPPSYGG
jgi:hypothetical protein